jgi:membrane protein YdbS with pleckstrin-like domain
MKGRHQVVSLLHQHWIAFLGRTWAFLALLLLMIIASGAFVFFGGDLTKSLDQQTQLIVQVGLPFVLVIYPLFRFLLAFFRWRAEEYVITNYRVIQLSGIFEKNVIDSSLEKVNDVLMHQSLIGRWLNYGNVEILTASEVAINKFDRVSHPLQFSSQDPQTLERPAQWRLWVTPTRRFHQTFQVGQEGGVLGSQRFASCSRTADALRRQGVGIGQFSDPRPDGAPRDAVSS